MTHIGKRWTPIWIRDIGGVYVPAVARRCGKCWESRKHLRDRNQRHGQVEVVTARGCGWHKTFKAQRKSRFRSEQHALDKRHRPTQREVEWRRSTAVIGRGLAAQLRQIRRGIVEAAGSMLNAAHEFNRALEELRDSGVLESLMQAIEDDEIELGRYEWASVGLLCLLLAIAGAEVLR